MVQGMRHKDSHHGSYRGVPDISVRSFSGGWLDVVLPNARDVKNITERKTDESDAEWLMLLHRNRLLKASFQPYNNARGMRTLTRHRNTLSRTVSSIALRMQKAMQQMNIKLTYYPEVSISQTVLLLVQHRTEHPNIRGGQKNIKLRTTPSEQCRIDF